MNLTDNQREWLESLYSDAIFLARATADNESAWAEGAPNEETAEMHRKNAEEQLEYAKLLEELKDNIGRL